MARDLGDLVSVHWATSALRHLGGVGLLLGQVLIRWPRRSADLHALAYQIEVIGMRSLSIAVLTAVFTSMVMAVQFAVQLDRFGTREYVSSVVAVSLVRELGPVLTALMVGGRVGAGIAAELGSMMVTEQVDAMRSMGADPIRTLVMPRVLASVVVLPLLTTVADVIGVIGAMMVSWLHLSVNPSFFFTTMLSSVKVEDFVGGLIKTVFFGLFMSVIACYQGLRTSGGTEGVGRATTQTVVVTSIVTLVSDFILTTLLLEFGL